MTSDLKNALRSKRDMDEYLEVRSTQEIIDDIKEVAGQEALRDQLAAQALIAVASRWQGTVGDIDADAQDRSACIAYQIADAMLRARAISPPTRSDAAE
jgi:hypothetical protein